MSKRTKKKVTTLIEAEELPEQMRKFAQATSQIKSIEADIEIEKQKIVKAFGAKLMLLNQVRNDAVDAMQNFCEHHREDLFKTKKSMDLAHGKLGFRLGTYKVEKISKKITWEGVLEQLQESAPDYVRQKPEINKELLIANREEEEVIELIKGIGLEINQEETFYVEAKEEDLVTN